jgi:glycosyltransferase involved in cell wall biosynthesis
MKKALFFTYFWPPSAKASLMQPLKLVTHLPESGIEPIVVTVLEENFTGKDESMLALVPPDVRVLRTKVWEPFGVYRALMGKTKEETLVASETISSENKSLAHRLSVWIRMNLFIPDARIGWYPFAVRECRKLLKNEKFDYIITNGPPHSTHLIGKKLSRAFGIPHIPIFIDPWVDIAYYQGLRRSKLTLAIDNALERSVVNNAALTVFVTPATKSDFIKKYPSIAGKAEVLSWGYDADAFDECPARKQNSGNVKTIVHAGNIFDYQNPAKLWEEVSARIKAGDQFHIKFIGSVSPLVRKAISDAHLESITEYVGYLPYKEMLAELCTADYLLVCATEKRHIPGKLYEYMHTGTPIIAFADDNTDIAALLAETGSGMLFTYNESPGAFFDKASTLTHNKTAALAYDRKVLTRHFGELLQRLPL